MGFVGENITLESDPTIRHIPKFGGELWFVDKGSGSDSNSGMIPDKAFETIGAAISACAAGDAITVRAGTYTEVGLDLDKDAVEIWFEIGVIIAPATGTALTVSGDYCKLQCPGGAARINPAANQTGLLVSGVFAYVHNIRVACASSADIGFDITGGGAVLTDCRCSAPLVAAFKIQGDKVKLDDCCTGGEVADTSIGFWVTNSCDKTRLRDCSSQGHSTAGYQVDSGVTNGVAKGCASGGGDGARTDADNSFVWSDFTFDRQVFKTTTFAGAVTEYNVFKVTGSVQVIGLFGHVTTVIPNTACNIHAEAYSVNGTDDITDAPGVDIDSALAGALLVRNGPVTAAFELGDPTAGPVVIENASYRDPETVFDLVADPGVDTYIRVVLSAPLASGEIHWHCEYDALTDGGFVEPA